MKRIKKHIVLFLFTVLTPIFIWAQFTETREISKRFKVDKDTRIEITNKYGKIELNTWDKDSAVFNISIRVEDKKLSKLEKSINDIDFDITDSQHFLIVRTKIGDNQSQLEKEFQKLKETLWQSDGKMEINYTVWLPKNNILKVENKFGDIFIGDYLGEVEINLSNGNLKSHDFRGKTNLTLSFVDATINEIESGRLNCNYSELYIKKAGNLRLTSKSSEFEMNEIIQLDTDSRRDKFRIRNAEMVEARGSFTNFRISELTDRITLRAEYGDIEIDNIATDFNNIYIESKSADIDLYFNQDSKFGFEITHTKATTNFSREINIEKEETLDEKEKKVKLTGFFGNSSEGTKLLINADSGEMNIRTN